jgi:tetratricopeptide (TPR) repeat protein
MNPGEAEIGTVAVGGYELRVGDPAGAEIHEGAGAGVGDEALARAFDADEPAPPARSEAFATEVEGAAEVTAKVEQTAALCKGVAAGEALSPDQLAIEIGSILDLCERLDRNGKYKDELRLARAVANLLMLLKRWAQLLQTLRSVLRLGQELNDLEAVAWAKHELGTLRLAAGQAREAERELDQALEVRERIGDRRAAALTNRNLQVLCKRLRRLLRDDELPDPGPRPLRRLLPLLAMVAFFLVGGVAGAVIGNDSESDHTTTITTTTTGTELPLRVVFAGDGGGRVRGEGEGCTSTCEGKVQAGEAVSLTAEADGESEFVGFSGPCQGLTCSFEMSEPTTVTATFRSTNDSSGNPEEEAQTEEERRREEIAEQKSTEAEAKQAAEQSSTEEQSIEEERTKAEQLEREETEGPG